MLLIKPSVSFSIACSAVADVSLIEVDIRGDGLRQFAHLAVDQRFDLVRVMSSLLVGVEVLLDVGIDLGKELAHVVVADPCTESSHRRLQVRESLVCTLGRSLVVAAEQLVYAKPRQHQVLERFAGKHHGVAVGGPADGPALQLLDLRAQFHSGRIKHVLCQLVLLPAQHNDLVEIPGISLELLCRVYELCALVRVQGNCDTLVQVILERAPDLLRGGRARFIAGQRKLNCMAPKCQETLIDFLRVRNRLSETAEFREAGRNPDKGRIGNDGNHRRDREHTTKADEDFCIDLAVVEEAQNAAGSFGASGRGGSISGFPFFILAKSICSFGFLVISTMLSRSHH